MRCLTAMNAVRLGLRNSGGDEGENGVVRRKHSYANNFERLRDSRGRKAC